MNFFLFTRGSIKIVLRGNLSYYLWVGLLLILIISGLIAYLTQFREGLIVTNMRDQVPWGFYIGNFTFLVGVAAAAIMLVIPAYVYNWKPIKEIAIIGELLAISALIMCLGFILADLGRFDRLWHIFPIVGILHFPSSLLAWDTIVLNAYLFLNLFVVTSLLYSAYTGKEYNKSILHPLILFSIPLAVGIHTVTAFLYNGLPARPFWNASILAPRFLASAFCSGPAILLILLQVLRRYTKFELKDEAIWKIAELMAYAMVLNMFLLGAEVFKEYYSNTSHLLYTKYLFSGIGEHKTLVPYAWTSVVFNLTALILFLLPETRKNPLTMNLGCVFIYLGVYIEKGIGLIIPGLTPDTLGEIYEYFPTRTELQIAAGIFSLGFLIFTLMVKVAVPISLGEFKVGQASSLSNK